MIEHLEALTERAQGWLATSPSKAIRSLPKHIAETACLRASEAALVDLAAYVMRDPAAHGDAELVALAYTAFHAVLGHRVAHALKAHSPTAARVLSEEIKVRTGIEIHPSARIGPGFVLDHGMGTVIGETCRIGANCTVLNQVVLGARGVASNPGGQRHPLIGDDVQVGSHVSILGPVTIGDGAFVGARCIITDDIPPGAKVTAQIRSVITRAAGASPIQLRGVVFLPEPKPSWHIFGSGFSCVVSVLINGCIDAVFQSVSDNIIVVEACPAIFIKLVLGFDNTLDVYLPNPGMPSNDNSTVRKTG